MNFFKIKNNKKTINIILNIIIITLLFFLFCVLFSFAIPKDMSKYLNKIDDLNSQIATLNEKVEGDESEITSLSENIKSLETENEKLKE